MATPWRDEFNVGIVPVIAHAVGDDGRHQRLDCAKHGHGEGGAEQTVNQVGAKMWNLQMWQAAGDAAETRADGFYGQFKEVDDSGSHQQRDDGSGNARRKTAADDQHEHGDDGERGRLIGECVEVGDQRFHAQPEHAGDFFEMNSKEVFDLCAGDEDGDAIGKSDDNRSRNELDGSAEAGCAHDDQEYPRHYRAHEQAVDAVDGDDARDYDHEGAGRTANLHFRSAQGGDQETGDDGTVDACLRRQS